MGEEVRKAVTAKGCCEEELLRRLRWVITKTGGGLSHAVGADEAVSQPGVMFPNTDAGWLATVRMRRSLHLPLTSNCFWIKCQPLNSNPTLQTTTHREVCSLLYLE